MTNTKYIEVAAAVTKEIRTPWGNVQMPISQLKTDSQIKCLILCLISKTTTKKQAAEEVSALYDVQGTQRKREKFKWKYLWKHSFIKKYAKILHLVLLIGDDIHRHIFDLPKLEQKYRIYNVS